MKALVYTRMGREAAEFGPNLIEEQQERCIQKAKELGVTEIVCYADKGFSVGHDRPSFNKMFNDYRDGDIIVADSPDRISRDMTQLLSFHDKYKMQYASSDFGSVPLLDDLTEMLVKDMQNRGEK